MAKGLKLKVIGLSDITRSTRDLFTKSERKYKQKLYKYIRDEIRSPETEEAYYRVVKSVLNSMQKFYFSGRGSTKVKDDPTRFDNTKFDSAIRSEISTNINIAASKFRFEPTAKNITLSITVLSNEFLGIGQSVHPKDPTPMKWIGFFLMGALETDLIWINEERAALLGEMWGVDFELGRFGEGFLYQAGSNAQKAAIRSAFKAHGLNYLDFRHPQSGKAGQPKVFEKAFKKEALARKIVQRAFVKLQADLDRNKQRKSKAKKR